ncbi:B12-binding domain-containing radical SAM protein [Candidatus Woesearchaeota archaeon]|nr:B12-binding domain-containing radical SAM protein [Candidatus Woesearchaeota archaeon]
MESPEIVLIFPNGGETIKVAHFPPHALLAVAAGLLDEYNVKLIDERIDQDARAKLKSYIKSKPICIALSLMTGQHITYALDTARFIRSLAGKDIPLVWGGVHATMLADQTLDNECVDIIVRGDGEVTFNNLVRALKNCEDLRKINGISFKDKDGNKIHNPDEKDFKLAEAKPVPWHLVDVEDYINDGSMFFGPGHKRMLDIGVTSKGCPHKCGFCYNLNFNKMYWRPMPSRKTFDFIKQCVDDFKLDAYMVHDDNYFVDQKRVGEIADWMIADNMDVKWTSTGITVFSYVRMQDDLKKKIVNSGCTSFRFGIESGNPRIIKLMDKPNTLEQVYEVNKDTKRLGINPVYSWMIGFPTETRDEIMDTCRLMVNLKKENKDAQFHGISVYTPYPGTPMYELAKQNGFVPPDKLEGWANIYWGSKSLEKSLAQVPRVFLDDVQDLSYLTSDWFKYTAPKWLKVGFWPVLAWLGFRWRHQMFSYSPEIKLYRKVRRRFLENAFVPELRAYRKLQQIIKSIKIALSVNMPKSVSTSPKK